MASLALAVAGAGIGAAIAPAGAAMLWAQTGYAIGSIAGSLLFPAKGQKVEGPRLQDLQIQSSAEGAPIAQTYGSMRIAGNVIWGKPLSEHRHKEKAGGKGGGGGATSVSYTYTADFAIALCEGPIDAVRKIWADGKLIYDVSEPTAAEEAIVAGGGYLADRVSALQASLEKTVKGGGTMRIYLGSETQLPDPLIEADLGAGNAPAFRGTAYLIFDNLALEDFGNRLPNITVEVISGTVGISYLGKIPISHPTTSGLSKVLNPSYITSSHIVASLDEFGTFSGEYVQATPYDIYPSGVSIMGAIATGAGVIPTKIGGSESLKSYSDVPARFQLFDYIGGPTSVLIYDVSSSPTIINYAGKLTPMPGGAFSGSAPNGIFRFDDEVYIFREPNLYKGLVAGSFLAPPIHGGDNGTRPELLYDFSAYTVRDLFVRDDVAYILDNIDSTHDDLVAFSLSTLSEIRRTRITYATAIVNFYEVYLYVDDLGNAYIISRIGAESYARLLSVDSVGSIIDYGQVSPITPEFLTPGTRAGKFVVDSGMLIAAKSSDLSVYYWALNAVGSAVVSLSEIVADICNRAGLELTDINVTDLASIDVKGYLRANQMTARSALEPLSQAYRFDATESDGVLKFVRRGTASVATLTVDDFALAGEQDGPHVTTLQQDNELPIELTVRYMDVDRDYQSGAQRARRLAPDSQQTVTIELPVVLHGDEAKQSAAVLQYLAWTERTKYQFALRPQHLKLDAGDVITAPIGGADRRLRLTQVTLADVLACEAVADDASVYVSAAVAAATTSAQQTISTPGTTIPAFLDIPILRDADDDADFYLGAVGTGSGWTGAAVYKSADRADWSRIDAVTEPSTIGTCTTLLPTGPTTVFDDGSTVTVRLISGTLSSVTEAQMCNGANAAAIGSMSGGWEIVGFQNASLQGDGTYLLSRFLRGRRGTEWAVGTHAIGDQFVLLESGDLIRPNTASTEINSARYYRLPSFGTQLVDASEITYTHQAIGKKPLSPVHIGGRRHSPSTNDWTISWVRRGRLDWEWRDYVDTPLGEASESYEIDIMSGSTVKRTLTATSQSVTYTAAQQTTDFGSVQTTLSVRVYQMSATVGRGYAGTATL